MKIIKGKVKSAQKVVIYGPEGIGKSTLASRFPNPLFIDTEGSTSNMDVARLEKPTSWTMLLEQITYVKEHTDLCKTLVIDTIDWAEQLCIEFICVKHQKLGIEDFGYGNGYVYVKEELGRFLNLLSDVIDRGIHVVLTAHAQIRKFEQPDELGAYDRYELKLGKKTSSQTAPLVKEWADMVLFANYKTHSVAVDDKGKKHKAQGGSRVMFTEHHPCWDAKNRHNLPAELPFEYARISHIFDNIPTQEPVGEMPKNKIKQTAVKEDPGANIPEQVNEEVEFKTEKKEEPAKIPEYSVFKINEKIPKALRDLMEANLVSEEEIQKVVAKRGYYPIATPITNYDEKFIAGVLVGAWKQI